MQIVCNSVCKIQQKHADYMILWNTISQRPQTQTYTHTHKPGIFITVWAFCLHNSLQCSAGYPHMYNSECHVATLSGTAPVFVFDRCHKQITVIAGVCNPKSSVEYAPLCLCKDTSCFRWGYDKKDGVIYYRSTHCAKVSLFSSVLRSSFTSPPQPQDIWTKETAHILSWQGKLHVTQICFTGHDLLSTINYSVAKHPRPICRDTRRADPIHI